VQFDHDCKPIDIDEVIARMAAEEEEKKNRWKKFWERWKRKK
jgi:hypothetical protein